MHINYNTYQMALDISLTYVPDETNTAWFINQLVNDLEVKSPYIFGRPREYSLSTVLKLILFAYTRGVWTSRKIEQLAEESMPARWLTQGQTPSFSTICRCRRAEELEEILDDGFQSLVAYLRERKLIDDHLFVDGTKLLADANKYSFVWKKNTIRFDESNTQKIGELLDELKEAYSAAYIPADTPLTLDQLEEVITILECRLEELEKEIEATPKVSPNPAKQTRRTLKSLKKKLVERIQKKANYAQQMTIHGERNSYSKTDHDATFMRMKEDPMRNGQLKPGYNLQIATSNQFTLAYDIYPNPTDTRTLPAFFETHRSLIESMTTVSADAGYGSESNYRFLEDEFPEITALIPYNTQRKEQTKKWQEDEKKVMNWQYNAEGDYYIDPHGVRFNFHRYKTQTDKYGMEREFKLYRAEQFDANNAVIPEALTPKGYVRYIQVNPSWEYHKAKQRETLSNPDHQATYARRKTDVETTFGYLKGSLGFTRVHVRGKDKVKQEVGIALMAANICKLAVMAKEQQRKERIQSQKSKIKAN